MPEAKKTYIPPEVLHLMELGRQGKLWTIEVIYSIDGESKPIVKRNMTGDEVLKFRSSMFQAGFTVSVGEGHWRVIPPMDIMRVDLYRQSVYFAGGV